MRSLTGEKGNNPLFQERNVFREVEFGTCLDQQGKVRYYAIYRSADQYTTVWDSYSFDARPSLDGLLLKLARDNERSKDCARFILHQGMILSNPYITIIKLTKQGVLAGELHREHGSGQRAAIKAAIMGKGNWTHGGEILMKYHWFSNGQPAEGDETKCIFERKE